MDILNFPPFSVFLAYISRPKVCIFIFRDFQFFAYIFQVLQCVFSFFTLFSDFIIFRRWWMFYFPWFSVLLYSTSLQWIFKFFHLFQFSSLIFHVLKCIFYFPWFSVFSLYSRSFSVHFLFFTFFSDFIIFRRWRMFFIFHDFQFCYIPRPTVDILNFPPFFSFPRLYFTS